MMVAAVLLSAGPAVAQEMTAEALEEAFARQKTRGLVLVPTTPEGEASAAAAERTELAAAPGYSAVATEDQINVQIAFDFDSAALREDQKRKLATMCDVMRDIDVALFQIIGHTDASGSAAYNESLSLLRAQEVKRFLVDDCGIAAGRLQAVGLGESAPLDTGDPNAERNRRVEFQALG